MISGTFQPPNRPTWVLQGSTYILSGCVLDEQHSDSAQVTEHPVEAGAPVTEYVVRANATYTCRVAIPRHAFASPTTAPYPFIPPQYPAPRSANALAQGGRDAVRNTAATLAPGLVAQVFPRVVQLRPILVGVDLFVSAYELLRQIHGRVAVSVTTAVRRYPKLVLTDVQVSRSNDVQDEFSLAFVEFSVASALTIDVPVIVANPALATTAQQGAQAPRPVTPAAAPQAQSFLDGILFGAP